MDQRPILGFMSFLGRCVCVYPFSLEGRLTLFFEEHQIWDWETLLYIKIIIFRTQLIQEPTGTFLELTFIVQD